MKKLILSLFSFCAFATFAQETMIQLESHTTSGEMVIFEGTDLSTGEKVSTMPTAKSEFAAYISDVDAWLFEGCYKYEVAPIRRPTTWDGLQSDYLSINHSGQAAGGGIYMTGDSESSLISTEAKDALAGESPSASAERGLLGHELTHVAQGAAGSGRVELRLAKEWVKPCPSH